MSNRLLKKYLPVTYAAKYSGYHADYITQLCRSSKLSCKSISKVWFVELTAIDKLIATRGKSPKEVDLNSWVVGINPSMTGADSFFINGREYVDTHLATKLSGYTRDYISQLARSNEIPARKLGKVWFVDRLALLSFKNPVSHQVDGPQKDNNSQFEYDADVEFENIPIIKKREAVLSNNQIHNSLQQKTEKAESSESVVKIKPIHKNKSRTISSFQPERVVNVTSRVNVKTSKTPVNTIHNSLLSNNELSEKKRGGVLNIVDLHIDNDEVYDVSGPQFAEAKRVDVAVKTSREFIQVFLTDVSVLFVFLSLISLVYVNLILLGVLQAPARIFVY